MDSFVNLGSFIIQFVNIVVIIFMLNKFLFKPYLVYLHNEEIKRKELEEAHLKLHEIKENAKKEAKTIIDDAKKEASFIKSQGETLAKEETLAIINEAKEESERIKTKAMLDIDNERKAMNSTMKEKILEVALLLNEKLFKQSEANVSFIKKNAGEEII
ncbi:ATP synthase F0 subunit B [Candidatus Gracilibacteria bacterium]|nr:ATP synthase F0 subunit B [Candidatus Gracilibacteria bacterium]